MVFVNKSTSRIFFLTKKSQKETFFHILDRKEWFHGFCLKIDLFLIRFFLSKKERKKHFEIFWIENKAFWTSKVNFSQSRKKSTLCKGVSPWFLSINRPFSRIFFLTKKSQKETFFHILDRKECFLDLKSEVLKNSKKLTFCKGVSPWFFSKNRPFSHLLFFF